MKNRPTWDELTVAPDANPGWNGTGQYPILSIAWYRDFGYQAVCTELASQSRVLILGTVLSKPAVYVELGGQGQELWPRELFVPLAVASKAIRHLLRTGTRDRRLRWLAIDTFPRRKVRARNAA
jgi:hypothetical protein